MCRDESSRIWFLIAEWPTKWVWSPNGQRYRVEMLAIHRRNLSGDSTENLTDRFYRTNFLFTVCLWQFIHPALKNYMYWRFHDDPIIILSFSPFILSLFLADNIKIYGKRKYVLKTNPKENSHYLLHDHKLAVKPAVWNWAYIVQEPKYWCHNISDLNLKF